MVFETIAFSVSPLRPSFESYPSRSISPCSRTEQLFYNCWMLDRGGRGSRKTAVSGSFKANDLWSDYECLALPPDVVRCGNPADLGASYAYLLGLYLGDGCLSRAPRNVWKLRIFQDKRYVFLIGECIDAIRSVAHHSAGTTDKKGCVEIYSNWKHWPCLFPQHGAGPKHLRQIVLREWQLTLARRFPRDLIRGLVQSDGCRAINRVRRPSKDGTKEYQYVRYFFSNASPDIRSIFLDACAQIGVDCRRTTERVVSVARRDSVILLDSFIGPKH